MEPLKLSSYKVKGSQPVWSSELEPELLFIDTHSWLGDFGAFELSLTRLSDHLSDLQANRSPGN